MTVFTEGADVGALREASLNFRRMAHAVNGAEREITHIVGSVAQQWRGADSSRASSRYSNEVRPALQSVMQLLSELATAIELNAAEQQGASSDGSPSGSSPSGGRVRRSHPAPTPTTGPLIQGPRRA